ncbi:MAG: XisI protein [Cyanobacteria bacterium P01_F01_bin.150]
MDKLESYRKAIQEFLTDYASVPVSNGDIETYTAFDMLNDHYQVINVGWDGYRRVYGCAIHLDIKDGKVWLQHNSTERRVGHELVDMGVDRQDIVLGFQFPDMRQYTEFASA